MALTGPVQRIYQLTKDLHSFPQAAVVAYHGGIAVLRAGYVRPGATALGDVCVGYFDFDAQGGVAALSGISDNSGGSAGDLSANVRSGICRVKNSGTSIAQANVGAPCFIVDDESVALTDGGTRSVAGTIKGVDSAGVWVEFGSVNGTSLAAEIVAREAVTTALALETTPGGASLVGVFDTAAKLTATTVEAALAENIDARRIALGTDGNTLPVPVCMVSKTIANTAGDTDVTLNATYGGLRITHVVVEKAAASSTGGDATITVKSTANAITETMALSGLTAGLVYRNTTIVPGYASIPSGGILRITAAKSTGDAACTVTVYGYRVA